MILQKMNHVITIKEKKTLKRPRCPFEQREHQNIVQKHQIIGMIWFNLDNLPLQWRED